MEHSGWGKQGSAGQGARRAAATAAAALACACAVLAVAAFSQPARDVEMAQGQALRGSELNALARLQARHAGGGRLRAALRQLEGNLEGELQSIKSILGDQGKGPETASSDGGEAEGSDDGHVEGGGGGDDDAADEKWKKRAMQRGALKGESVEDQLRKALEHSMNALLRKEAKWRSAKDLEQAEAVADYIRMHPLPMPRARDGDGDGGAGAGGVQKVMFNRQENGLTAEQYKDLVKALRDAVEQEEQRSSGGAGGTVPQAGHVRGAQRAPARPDARPPARAQQRQGGGGFEPWVAAQALPYAKQGGGGVSVMELAREKGRGWVDREILREHGEYVHLPSRDAMPLPVLPYWHQ